MRKRRCSCKRNCTSRRWASSSPTMRSPNGPRTTPSARPPTTSGPRSSEVATGLQQLSHVYTLTQRRELAVDPARRSFDLRSRCTRDDSPQGDGIDAVLRSGAAVRGRLRCGVCALPRFLGQSARVFGDDSRIVGESLSAFVPLDIEIGDLKAAIANARRAIEIYLKEEEPEPPTHAGRVRKLGSALLAARSSGEAAERLEEAVGCRWRRSRGWTPPCARSLGLALAYLGRFDEAENNCDRPSTRADVSGPRDHLAMRNLGTLLRLQGRYADPCNGWRRVTRRRPFSPAIEAITRTVYWKRAWRGSSLASSTLPSSCSLGRRRCSTTCSNSAPRLRAPICWSGWRGCTCSVATTSVRCNRRRKPISSGVTSIRRTAGRAKRRSGLAAAYLALGRNAEALEALGRASTCSRVPHSLRRQAAPARP